MSTSSSEIKKQLSALPFWGALTAREQETMCACAQIRCYAKGELIYSKEQECLGLIRVLSGAIRTFMLSDEGREVRLYRVDKNDTDVLSASCVMNQITFETQMVADENCTLLIVPAVCLKTFKENNLHVRCFLFEKLGERFSDVMLNMQAILFTRLDRRIAEALLSRGGTTVRVTHEQLAGEVNSTREAVSRILKDMERQSLIRLGRGQITLIDPEALRRL
ncbi:MAG: Crp/Fnr family transcriptional regulator [Clostridia bacterium]|nr:Crp/Fnr family transcriptional regulator [Clostridia bacterium]